MQFWDSPLLPPHSAIFGIQSQPAGESNESFVRATLLRRNQPYGAISTSDAGRGRVSQWALDLFELRRNLAN